MRQIAIIAVLPLWLCAGCACQSGIGIHGDTGTDPALDDELDGADDVIRDGEDDLSDTGDVPVMDGPGCGNGIVEGMEQCDRSDLDDQTCETLGYDGGTLGCTESCLFDAAGCSGADSCGNGALDDGEDCDDGNDVDWDGCTDCQITEMVANAHTLYDQRRSDIAMASDGRFVLVWESGHQDGDGYGIFARVFDRGWVDDEDIQVNSSTEGDQTNTVVAMAEDGEFLVSWLSEPPDPDFPMLLYRVFDETGMPRVDERMYFSTDTVSSSWQMDATAVHDGGYAVVYSTSVWETSSSRAVVHLQFVDDHGVPPDSYYIVSDDTWNQDFPAVVSSPLGWLVVTWSQWEGTSPPAPKNIVAKRMNQDGTAHGSKYLVSTVEASYKMDPVTAVGPEGNMLSVWSVSVGMESEINARALASNITPTGPVFQVNSHTEDSQSLPDVAMDFDGSYVIVWMSQEQDGDASGIYMRRFDASGTPMTDEIQVNILSEYSQSFPAVAMRADGCFTVTWTSLAVDGDAYGVSVAMFDPAGRRMGPWQW